MVAIHFASRFYDVEGFRKGRSSLLPVEVEEMGDVTGKALLHLQCHFGLDTLSWARNGAIVTGVDFSHQAIETAKRLAIETGVEARFVESDLLALENALEGEFDIVFSSYGVLCWLPDLQSWAKTIAHFLKPGGFFYLAEDHPSAQIIDARSSDRIQIAYPYFTGGKPTLFRDLGTYTDRNAKLDNSTTYEWTHTMGDVLNSLIEAGLRVEFVHEFPFSFFKRHEDMEQKEDGTWHFKDHNVSFPMVFTLRARKP